VLLLPLPTVIPSAHLQMRVHRLSKQRLRADEQSTAVPSNDHFAAKARRTMTMMMLVLMEKMTMMLERLDLKGAGVDSERKVSVAWR
jgi:hypothetical protein